MTKIPDTSKRDSGIDFIRGLAIFFAIQAHYSYFIQYWFSDYASLFYGLENTGHLFQNIIRSTEVSVDATAIYVIGILMPWLTHLYFFLSGMNIGRKPPELVKKSYKSKMIGLGLLFVLFLMERRIVSVNFGDGFSFYPILSLIVCHGLSLTLYRISGEKAVVYCSLVALVCSLVPYSEWNQQIELWIKGNFHQGFKHDSPILEFLGTMLLGVVVSKMFLSISNEKKILNRKSLTCGLVILGLAIPFIIKGSWPNFQTIGFIDLEDKLAQTTFGLWVIWAICISIGLFSCYFKNAFAGKFCRPICWIGKNSLYVFFCHQIIMLFLLLPMTTFVFSKLQMNLTNSYVNITIFSTLAVGICWGIKKYNIFSILRTQD